MKAITFIYINWCIGYYKFGAEMHFLVVVEVGLTYFLQICLSSELTGVFWLCVLVVHMLLNGAGWIRSLSHARSQQAITFAFFVHHAVQRHGVFHVVSSRNITEGVGISLLLKRRRWVNQICTATVRNIVLLWNTKENTLALCILQTTQMHRDPNSRMPLSQTIIQVLHLKHWENFVH